jgi:GNAT superfamily N-acetyltransferase
MAGNLYDETLEDLEPPQVGPVNPYLATIDAQQQTDERGLRQATATAQEATPDRTAEAIRIGRQLGLPVEVVERNFEAIKKRAALEGSPYAEMLRQTPALAEWAQDADHMKVAADDLEQLGALEWLLTTPGRSFAQGVNQVRFGQLKTASIFRALTREEQDQVNAYKFHMTAGGEFGAGTSWFRKAIVGGTGQLPNLFGAALYALKYGAIGAVPAAGAGAVIGSIVPGLGTGAGAYAGARLGFQAGTVYGAGKFGFEIEAGNALDEYESFRDEHGQPLDPAVARAAAIATGALNAGLEALSFQVLLKSIPGLNKLGALAVRQAVKKALLVPSVRAGLADAMKSYAGTLTFETMTEVAQRAVTILSGELGKASSGQDIERRKLTEPSSKGEPSILEDLGREAVGALQAFALTVAGGPVLSVAHAQAQARRAQQAQGFFTALGQGVSGSKTFQRLPEAAQSFVERVTKNGPLESVYAPVDSWVTYWQSQGVDPAAMATELTGQGDALAQAQRTGEDLVIPTARYATTLAGTAHNGFFARELRLAPGEMNAREADAFEAALKATPEVEVAPGEDRAAAVRQAVLSQLVSAGVPAQTAESYADLYHQTFGTLAERAGVDPLELYRQYGFAVTREALKARAPTETAGAQAEAAAPLETVVAPTTEGSAASSAPGAQLTPLEAEVPGLAALEADLGGATIEQVAPGVTEINASGESAASTEARHQREAMAAAGQLFGVYDRAGRFRPMHDVGAKDYHPARGESFGVLSAAGFQLLEDNGGAIPLDTTRDVANNIEVPYAEQPAAPAAGPVIRDRAGERPDVDAGRRAEAPGDELRPEPVRLPTPDPDEIFSRKSAAENALRFTPEIVRELERIYDELSSFPYIPRSWTWLAETEENTGNAAGGKANIVAGAAGAEVYHDILSFSPVARVTQGRRKGLPAREASGTRRKVQRIVRETLESKDIRSGLAEGAVRVAERRNVGDYSIIMPPMLPPSWGQEVDDVFTNTLSEAITDELESTNMLDEATMESDLLEPEGPVDTSFNVEEFYQSLFDQIAPDTGVDQLTTATPSQRQEPAPAAEPPARKVRKGSRITFQGKEYFLAKIYQTHVDLQEWVYHERGLEPVSSGFLSVPIRQFWKGYQPSTVTEGGAADILDTGEVQPRLPGDVGAVRDLNVPTPEFEAPFSLTAPVAKGAGKQTTLFQPAYHGTAAVFEQFSLQAIGTGEGAQAYGWGLYFASLRDIAEQYRKSLAGEGQEKQLGIDGEPLFTAAQPRRFEALHADPKIAHGLLELHARAFFKKPGKTSVAEMRDELERSVDNLTRRLDAGDTWSGDRHADEYRLADYSDALAALNYFGDRMDVLPPNRPGRVYKVEIPEDDDFLSWDFLASRQSPKVQAALQALGFSWVVDRTPTLKEARRLFESKHAQAMAAEDIGIRESLREGFSYVTTGNVPAFNLWYQQNIGLLRARGRAEETGAQLYEQLIQRAQQEERDAHLGDPIYNPPPYGRFAERASRMLSQAGIAGIRYLDGFSRSKGEGSQNYVVFDDRLVQITEFYQRQPQRDLTTADVRGWADDLKARIGPDLASLELYVTVNGDVQLDALAVRRGAARAGLGSRVMQEVCRFADLNGRRIIISVAEKGYQPIAGGEKTTSRSRLERFYRRFGFVRNAGRYYDPSIKQSMYRQPTLAPALEVPIHAPVMTETAAFKTWFGDSAVRNEDGTPKVAHHGTARGDRVGNVFRKRRATSGPMPFFTESAEIAQRYAETKADTSLEAPEDYAGWFKILPKGARTEVDLRRGWWHLTPAEQQTVIKRLPFVGYQNADQAEGPIVYPSQTISSESHVSYLLAEAHGNGLAAAMELWLSSGTLFGDEARFLEVLTGLGLEGRFRFDDPQATHPRVYDVYLSIQRPLVTSEIPAEVLSAFEQTAKASRRKPVDYGADLWDKRRRDLRAWVTELQADVAAGKNSHVWTSIPDAITDTLKRLGYDGIEDRGGKLGGDEHVVWIPFEPTQIKSVENRGTFDPLNPNILKQEKRGAIRFGPDRQFSIALLEKADLSTFLHETGHFFFEVMADLADRLKAADPAQLTDTQRRLISDYEGLLEHFGVPTRDGITEAHHEQFARLFEAYLMEGRAPSLVLESTFARFRAWLLGVYRSLVNLHISLTPEVRGILDRLVASDLAIAQAEQRRGVPAMFTTAETAGMTAAEFGLYRETVARASRTARQRLDAKLLAEVRREQEESWKAQRDEIRGEVEAAIFDRPEYRALAAITRGTQPNGDALVEGLETKPMRLSRAILVTTFGTERLKRLPRFSYVKDGGVDPETVAGMFGFSSADALLTALEAAPPMRQLIEQQTTARMLQEHGSMLLDGTLAEIAQAAVANEDRDSIIRAELRALAQLKRTAAPFVAAGKEEVTAERRERAYERRWIEAETKLRQAIAVGEKQVEIDRLQGEVRNLRQKARGGPAVINAAIPPDALIRENARARIARMTIRGIRPDLFWAASRRASQTAVDRAARQDFDGAIAAKQQELINLALFREAERVLEDITARVTFAKGLGSKAARARLGLAGQSYQDQVDGILDAYEFARVPAKALERRASLARFLAGLEAAGLPVPDALPVELQDETRRTNYQNLTVEELVGITDGLKMIVHLARLKNKLLKSQDEREFGEIRAAIVDSIRAHSQERPLPLEFTAGEEVKRRAADWFASHTKIAQLAQALDGYVDGGPLWRFVIKPINDAADAEAKRNAEAGGAYTAILERFYTSRDLSQFAVRRLIPAIGASLSKEARLAVALNWGNQTSRDRLLADPRRKWDQQQVEAILATLDKRDWDFIQATWDFVDTFWPEIVAKQERVIGVAPEKVEALAVHTAFGDYRGGYYPLMYDPRLNLRSQQLEAASEARGILQAAYVSNTTKRGHIETRKAHVKLSIRLDLGVVFQHVQQVIHDLTHHEALLDVQRVLRDSSISNAILETKGDIIYQQFTRALQDIAAGNVNGRRANMVDRAATFARQGTQLSLLGLNLWTAVQQPLGVFNGMARVGPRWVARGIRRWLRDASHLENTVKWINSVSPMMKYRLHTATQDLSDLRLELRRAGGWFDKLIRKVSLDHLTQTALLDGYLFHIGLAQRVADVPTWLGMYEKTKAGGGTEADAIALADQAVLDSQGAGQIKDLAQVQRGGPVARLFMTFYTYGNTVFNQTARELGRVNYRSPVSVIEMLGNLSLIYIMPAFLTIAMSRAFGRTGGDDDDWGKFLLNVGEEILSTALNTMIFVREMGGLIGEGTRGYAGPAGARILQLSYQLGTQLKQAELDEGFFRAVNAVGGIVFRYPSAQVERTVRGIIALEEDQTDNPAAVLFGPKTKGTK